MARAAAVVEEVAWPTAGRVVHVCVGEGEWRPATVIVSDAESRAGHAQVFLLPDDLPFSPLSLLYKTDLGVFYPVKAARHGDDVGCWRWPPRD